MSERVLVIGATGAMGSYLVPYLTELGYRVTAVSLDRQPPLNDRVECLQGNFFDPAFRDPILDRNYDGIVDFLSYGKHPFADYMESFLSHTGHYVFLSSCRVYANEEIPVRETSPRLLDVSTDQALLASNDYCMHKARAEDLLWSTDSRHFSIVRPATILSRRCFKLVTLEEGNTVGRARRGKKAVLPIQAKEKPATLSWAGDVSREIALLLFKEEAKREAYNVCSAEHRTWGEIAGYYHEFCGLESVWVDKEDYLKILDPADEHGARYQLEYARLFDRITDNSKILKLTGLKQEDMKPMRQAIREMFEALPADAVIPENAIGERMDTYLREHGL